MQSGYRDGLDEGKELTLQHGFNAGTFYYHALLRLFCGEASCMNKVAAAATAAASSEHCTAAHHICYGSAASAYMRTVACACFALARCVL